MPDHSSTLITPAERPPPRVGVVNARRDPLEFCLHEVPPLADGASAGLLRTASYFRIFGNAEPPPCSGLAHPVKNGPAEMRILSTSKMHYVSQITPPLRVQYSDSIDTAVPQSLDRSDILTDDGELPNPWHAPYPLLHARPVPVLTGRISRRGASAPR